MRLLTPSRLREILDDPRNSLNGGHAFDLNLVCIAINQHCSGAVATRDPHGDDDACLVAKA